MYKCVYLLSSIEDYGKFIAFCINHDIAVFRAYWDEREKGDRCFQIVWSEKRCYYCSKSYYESRGFDIIRPVFVLDDYGNYFIREYF